MGRRLPFYHKLYYFWSRSNGPYFKLARCEAACLRAVQPADRLTVILIISRFVSWPNNIKYYDVHRRWTRGGCTRPRPT